MTSHPPQALAEQILQLNARAFDAGQFEAAYHLLMAAVHLADHHGDAALLERIHVAALEQERALEQVQPPHRLSARNASLRGQVPVFQALRTHIESVRLRLESRRLSRGA